MANSSAVLHCTALALSSSSSAPSRESAWYGEKCSSSDSSFNRKGQDIILPSSTGSSDASLLGGVVKAGVIICTSDRILRAAGGVRLTWSQSKERQESDLPSGPWTRSYVVLVALPRTHGRTRSFRAKLCRFESPKSDTPLEEIELDDSAKVTRLGQHHLCMLQEERRHQQEENRESAERTAQGTSASRWVLACDSASEADEWNRCIEKVRKGDLGAFQSAFHHAQHELAIAAMSSSALTILTQESDDAGSETDVEQGNSEQTTPPQSGWAQDWQVNSSDTSADGTSRISEMESLEELRKRAASGGLWQSGIRSIAWRRLLGMLNSAKDGWDVDTRRMRLDYDRLVSKHIITSGMVNEQRSMLETQLQRQHFSQRERVQQNAFHKGSYGQNQVFEHRKNETAMLEQLAQLERQQAKERARLDETLEQLSDKLTTSLALESEIWKDLDRTRVSNMSVGGQNESTKQVMLRILLVWAKAHPNIGYKQGMNEILAVLLQVLHSEYGPASALSHKRDRSHDTSDHASESASVATLFPILTDRSFLEHDAYLLFDRILLGLLPVYDPKSHVKAVSYHSNAQDADLFGPRSKELPDRLEHVQNTLLQLADFNLAAKLHMTGVEPHMYLIRWMRVLFAREIPVPQLLLVWDAIFATTPLDFSLTDSVCAALLAEPQVRDALLQAEDAADALGAIKKIPTLEDTHVARLVFEAVRIHKKHEQSALLRQAQLEKQRIEAAAAQLERATLDTTATIGGSTQASSSAVDLNRVPSIDSDSDWLKIERDAWDMNSDAYDAAGSGGERVPVMQDELSPRSQKPTQSGKFGAQKQASQAQRMASQVAERVKASYRDFEWKLKLPSRSLS